MITFCSDLKIFRDNFYAVPMAHPHLVAGGTGFQACKKPFGELNVEAGLAEGFSLWVSLKHAKAQGLELPPTLIQVAADKLWDENGNVVKE